MKRNIAKLRSLIRNLYACKHSFCWPNREVEWTVKVCVLLGKKLSVDVLTSNFKKKKKKNYL